MKKRFRKVYIEITNKCNLKCEFCPKTLRNSKEMTVSEFEHVILQVKEYTDLIYLHVKGEPLLHSKLEDILKICEQNNIMVNLTTNGTLLKAKENILNKSNSLRQINISIHSAVENNKDKTQIEKYMNDILNVVDTLKNKCIISYRLWNLDNIKENSHNKLILDILRKKYVDLDIYDLAKSNQSLKLENNVYLNQDLKFEWPNINSKEISKSGTCLGLKNQIAILSNGDITPCCLDENANILLGNIFKDSIADVINSEKSQSIIRGFNENKLKEKLCQTCGFRKKFESNKMILDKS